MLKINFKFAFTCLCAIAIVLLPSKTNASVNFSDVEPRHWAYEDIQSLAGKNVLNGYSNGSFKPSGNVTRAQAAKILSLAAEIEPIKPKEASYPDVAIDHWAFSYIEALKKAGTIDGKSNGTYGPDELLTRGQMAKILSKSFGLVGSSTNTFEDVKAGAWMFNYVMALRDNGITVGYSEDNTFKPDGMVTRAQMAAFANRAMLWKAWENADPADKVIAFGDSNTSGSYLPKEFPEYPDHNWPALLGIKNAGVSGNTTASALKRFEQDVLLQKPSAVVMMFGLNDALIRPDTKEPQVSKVQFRQNILNMVSQLKTANIDITLMTNLPVNESIYYHSQRNENPGIRELYAPKGGIRAWQNSYNEIIREIASQENISLIDNYANAVQKAGGATDTAIAESGLVDPLLGFHWTPRGHLMVEYSVRKALGK